MRQFRNGGFTISGPLLSGQQAPREATTPQPNPRVAALMAPEGFGGSGSTLTAREVSATVAVRIKYRYRVMMERSAHGVPRLVSLTTW
jgi:hypothetical protein